MWKLGLSLALGASLLALPVIGGTPAAADAPQVAAAQAPIAAEPTIAGPGGNVTYFSDPFYSTVVGQFGYDCCNNKVAWGSKTPFSMSGGCFPCFPPPK